MTAGSLRMQRIKGDCTRHALTVLRWLIEPIAVIDEKQRRKVRLLSAFLLLFAIVTLIGAMAVKNAGNRSWFILLVTAAILVIEYILSRVGYHRLATVLAVSTPAVTILSMIFLSHDRINLTDQLVWLALPLLVCSLLLTLRYTIITAISYIVVIIVLIPFSNVPAANLGQSLASMFMIFFFVVAIAAVRQQDQSEIEHQLTERKQAEEKLKQALANLEHSNTQLAAINRELEAFSYSTSHDLRAPLRTIDGFSQALLEDYQDKLDEQGKDYLQRVRSASQRMAALIDDLLKLSRLSRSGINKEPVDLSALAQEITTRLQETQPGRQVEFLITSGLTASGDRQLLRVAMENLLGNAWKFTGKRQQAKIEFGITHNGDRKTYFVRDNGAGFDMTYVDKLFGPFQRLHETTEFPGTGIGLATVQRIIHRHGGHVWAEGAVGEGATFYFTLS